LPKSHRLICVIMDGVMRQERAGPSRYAAHADAAMRVAVLKDLEAIRRRPGVYIGDTRDGAGVHRVLYELMDNAIDEALAGHCDRIEVTLNAGGPATVRDNGRGIPTEIHERARVSAAEFVMTRLFPPGKVERDARERPGRRLGIGLPVVNALS